MSNLKFIKAGVSISSVIAKETILSKIINTVNVFFIDVAHKNFDDLQRKYIDTILKLDDSKTIVLETKWEEITTKNMTPFTLHEWELIILEYSSILEDDNSCLFINYTHITELPIGTLIWFEWSTVMLKVVDKSHDIVKLSIVSTGDITLWQKIVFQNYVPKISFLSEKDKKNVIRWLQSGINVLSAWSLKTSDDIVDMKTFLQSNNGQGMKVYARITLENINEELDDIIKKSDGVVIHHDDWDIVDDYEWDLIVKTKLYWKPLIISLSEKDVQNTSLLEKKLYYYVSQAVDVITISESVLNIVQNPLDYIQYIFNLLHDIELDYDWKLQNRQWDCYKNNVIHEGNYLISLLPKIIEDIDAKIILCYTGEGMTAARISALGMDTPLLMFTRDDFSYRYNNLLRGVKGYKIWQTSTYQIFKQIGKEMIRIYFKGNISLDDKVIIINVIESEKDKEVEGLINGLEIYKFKNI
jgi:pyruvate kinase